MRTWDMNKACSTFLGSSFYDSPISQMSCKGSFFPHSLVDKLDIKGQKYTHRSQDKIGLRLKLIISPVNIQVL